MSDQDSPGCGGIIISFLVLLACIYAAAGMGSYLRVSEHAASACPRSGVAYRTLNFNPIWPTFTYNVHCLDGKTVHITGQTRHGGRMSFPDRKANT